MKLLANFGNPFRNPIQRPYSGDFVHEIHRGTPCENKFWRIFTAANEWSTLENINQSQVKGILRKFSGSIFKISKEFHKRNEKSLYLYCIT
jgi:hypothetical protein